MKSREGGGKRKYAWGWLRKECSECTPPTSPKSLMFTVSGFLTNYFFFPFNLPKIFFKGNYHVERIFLIEEILGFGLTLNLILFKAYD